MRKILTLLLYLWLCILCWSEVTEQDELVQEGHSRNLKNFAADESHFSYSSPYEFSNHSIVDESAVSVAAAASSVSMADHGGNLQPEKPISNLQRVFVSELEHILYEKCALFCVEPCEPSLVELFRQLEVIFQNDEDVFLGLLADAPKILWQGSVSHSTLPTFAFYSKEVRDRTCLLASPKDNFLAEGVSGLLAAETLVQFINEKCGTFRTVSGELTDVGKYHQHIMSHLYHPEEAVGECERIRTPTEFQFLQDYLLRSKPVVIEDAVTNWPAIEKWSKEYLHRLYGHRSVHVKLTPDGEFEGVENAKLWRGYHDEWIPERVRSQLMFPDLVVVRPATAEIPFSNFLDIIYSGNLTYSAYLEYSSIPDQFPELERDIIELPFVKGLLERRHLNIWLSDGNTLGKLHFDPFDNLLCQVVICTWDKNNKR